MSVCIFLVLAVLVAFGQTAHFDFINCDDDVYVYQNSHVSGGLTGQGVAWVCTHVMCNFYHPLTMLSLMADAQLHGLDAGGFHVTSVLIHAASSVLLFLVLWRMTGALWRGAFIAAVFAVHPLRAESVAWVAERKDVLGAFFFILSLAAYVRYVRKPKSVGRYLTVVACFVLALLCKPTGVTLPFVLLLLDYWPLGRTKYELGIRNYENGGAATRGVSIWVLVREKIPLMALAVAAGIVTYMAEGSAVASVTEIPLPVRIGSAFVAYVVYLRQMLWPAGLSLFYPYAAGSQLLWQAPLAVSLLAGICAGVLTYWRKHPWLLVGWLWYLGMMVPMIGLVAICPSPYGDRNTYLPQIGVSLLLTWTVADWSARWKYRRMILGGLMAAVLVALTVSACAQTSYWRNNRELWTRVLVCTPGNSIARDNLGAALLKDGQTDDAIAQFRAALKIRPAYPHALYNLGIALARKKEFDQAIAQYRQALAFDPNYVEAWSNLGITLFDKGEVAEAISAYSKALQINPRYPEARYNLGIALFAAGEKGEAIAQYRKALEINPAYAEARYNLANGLLQLGQLEEAITQYRQALATTPDDPRLLNNLGIALAVQGANEEAITQYRKALRINPGFIDAQYDLGLALVKLGKMDEAAAQFRQALDLAVAQKNDRSVAMLEKQIKLCEAASKSPP